MPIFREVLAITADPMAKPKIGAIDLPNTLIPPIKLGQLFTKPKERMVWLDLSTDPRAITARQ
ncbi:MAG: hypothetical protein ACLP2Q_08485 [Steroidobacteraceae bacterium]